MPKRAGQRATALAAAFFSCLVARALVAGDCRSPPPPDLHKRSRDRWVPVNVAEHPADSPRTADNPFTRTEEGPLAMNIICDGCGGELPRWEAHARGDGRVVHYLHRDCFTLQGIERVTLAAQPQSSQSEDRKASRDVEQQDGPAGAVNTERGLGNPTNKELSTMTVVSPTTDRPEQVVHTTWCTAHDEMGCSTHRHVTRTGYPNTALSHQLEMFRAGDDCPTLFYIDGKPFDLSGAEALRDRLSELLSLYEA